MTSLTGTRVGQKFGNYRLERLIGRGGFAEIYRGEHIYLKTHAAIKILHTQLSREDQESFLYEARTIAHLKHPNILPVLEFGIEEGIPFLVMDEAPNRSLRERHPKGDRLTPIAALPYIKQVATALHYAHQEHIVHRDIKPENMLLGTQNEALLSDFGIALGTRSSRTQSLEDIAGTVAYMAPESLQGRPGPASDQYSLGIVLYEWLNGDYPFHGSFSEIASQQVLAVPSRIQTLSVSPEVETVLLRALAKAPEQRFENVLAFSQAFEQATMEVGETFRARPGWRPPPTFQQQPIQTLQAPEPRTIGPDSLPTTPLPSGNRSVSTQIVQRQSDPSRRVAIILMTLALLLAITGLVGAFYLLGPNAGSSGTEKQDQAMAQASATSAALQNQYTQITSGKPAFSDPLNTNKNKWTSGTDQGGSCLFKANAYHIRSTTSYVPQLCEPESLNKLSNFVYQVQMTILQGDEGGMFFRLSSTQANNQPVTTYYLLSVNRSGTYTLMAYKLPQFFKLLVHDSSTAIKSGLNQKNLLTIIAQGKQLALYINKQFVTSVTDDIASAGNIGLLAAKTPDITEVAYSNVQVWKL